MLKAEYHPGGLSLIEGVGSITGLLEEMYWFEAICVGSYGFLDYEKLYFNIKFAILEQLH